MKIILLGFERQNDRGGEMEISAGVRKKMEEGRKGVFSEVEMEQAAAQEWGGQGRISPGCQGRRT